jgi:hypothetical protein
MARIPGIRRLFRLPPSNATDSALVESIREFRAIAREPVPPVELRGALSNLVGSFPSSVQTVQGLAGDLAAIEEPIRGRNLGTVEVWTTAGERIR